MKLQESKSTNQSASGEVNRKVSANYLGLNGGDAESYPEVVKQMPLDQAQSGAQNPPQWGNYGIDHNAWDA